MELKSLPFEVGHWTVDPVASKLRDGERTVDIEPKLVKVLRVLAEHAGKVVTKDDLIRAGWGDRPVGDDRLTNAIYRLRKKLGDADYIRTEHGEGYCLTCEVSLPMPGQASLEAGATGSDTAPAAHRGGTAAAGGRRPLAAWGLVLGAIAVVTVLAVGTVLRQAAPTAPITVAAVPFENLDVAGDQLLGRAVTRDVLDHLNTAPRLAVISDSVSFPQLNTGIDVVTLGETIGADYVIDGTIDIEPQQITVSVELINTRKGVRKRGLLLESDVFYSQPDALNDLAGRIAAAIANWLGAGATFSRSSLVDQGPTASPEASRLYYAGIEFLKRTNEQSNLRRAMRMFEDALGEDPRYAAALAGSCEAHLRLYIVTSEESLYDTAVARCNRALLLEPELTQAQVSMGTLYREAGKPQESQTLLQSVLASRPNHVDAMIELAETLADLGREEEAEQTLRKAVALQPGYWESYSALGLFLYYKGEYQEALEHFVWVTQLMPDSAIAHANVGDVHYLLGDTAQAREALDRSIALEPVGFALRTRGLIAYYDGDFALSADAYEEAIAVGDEDYWVWGLLAEASRFVPARAEAVRGYLEKAAELAEQRIVIKPTDAFAWAQSGLFQARLGNFPDAHRRIAQAHRQSPQDMDVIHVEAAIWAEQGDAQQVCDRLRSAVALGFDRGMITRDPDFKPFLGTTSDPPSPSCL
jgi:tetratricopeptide (TPR) repeat protein/DNA-binding winged helix-turn-helix (wHTH) protein